jgi:hypothetical protein
MVTPHSRRPLRSAARAALASALFLAPAAPAQDHARTGIVPGSATATRSPVPTEAPKVPSKDWVTADESAASRAVQELGESPTATLLDALGPDVRRYHQHIMALSDPFFEGRAPGTAGNRHAADYIEFYFRQAGLRPAFPTELKAADGSTVIDPSATFRQPFRAGTDLAVRRQELACAGKPLTPGKDFVPLGSSGTAELSDAPLVFVGYAVENAQERYSTFESGTDLSGKVAVVFRFEPLNEQGRSKWVERGWSPASGLDAKLNAIAERKAAAIILVNPPGAEDPRAAELMDTKASQGASRRFTIPILMMTPQALDRILSDGPDAGATAASLRKAADEKGTVRDLGARVSIATELAREPVMTDNVGGVLPGRGKLAEQFIIIGAHYDHVGYGPIGIEPRNAGKLHPGADDNASGTSAVLMLADRLARRYEALPPGAEARSILFMCFSAEESGLNGSRWWVNHPSISLSQVHLMINMDMIGRLRAGKLDVDGSESAEGLYAFLKPIFDRSGLSIGHGFRIPENSDHYSFYARQIPILNLFTGYHGQYHKPGDEGFTINPVGAVRIIDLVEEIALGQAQQAQKLAFKPSRKADQEEEDQPALPAVPVKVRFGITPGYMDNDDGVLVEEVHEGTSAADAGIRVGDRMLRWNGKEIRSVEAWMPLLSGAVPGDVVEVVVKRGDQDITIKVTLKAREQGKN